MIIHNKTNAGTTTKKMFPKLDQYSLAMGLFVIAALAFIFMSIFDVYEHRRLYVAELQKIVITNNCIPVSKPERLFNYSGIDIRIQCSGGKKLYIVDKEVEIPELPLSHKMPFLASDL